MRTNRGGDSGNGAVAISLAIGACLIAMMAVIAVNIHTPSQAVDAVAALPGLSATVEVSLAEFTIAPSRVTAKAGLLELEVTNDGSMVHNLAVPALGKKTGELPPGAKASLALGTVADGTYPILCEESGHADQGMTGTLVVGTGKSAAGASSGGTGNMAGMDMSGSSSTSSSTATSDTGTMSSAQMEKSMTAGVNTFLAYAKKYGDGTLKTGNQPLAPTVLPDGTKQFHLTAAITRWEVSPGKVVKAWTYNGMVPGPSIHIDPGDKVQLVITNHLPISTDVHMHGIDVPFDEDGLAPITQPYIEPGQSYTYSFTASTEPKLGMYHAHMDGAVAIPNGLFGAMEIGDVALPTGKTVDDLTVPATLDPATIKVVPMVLNDAGVIGLSLNGKAFPETQPIVVKKGTWFRLDYYNEGSMMHPMHIHHLPQLVIAQDGYPLTAPYRVDTLPVAPGQRYSVLVYADDVGTWAFHCHIVSHAEGANGFQGMVTAVIVQP